MPASPARRARRKAEKAMQAMGVELVEREHVRNPEDMSREDLVDMIAYKTALAIKRLALEGADLDDRLAITVGRHPSFKGSITIEAKAARRQTFTKIEVDPTVVDFSALLSASPSADDPRRLLDVGDLSEPIDPDGDER